MSDAKTIRFFSRTYPKLLWGQFLGVVLAGFLAMSVSSCALLGELTGDEAEPAMTFERYDNYTSSLHTAVNRGELTTTEAERLRKKAYQDYLKHLKIKTIEREGERNW